MSSFFPFWEKNHHWNIWRESDCPQSGSLHYTLVWVSGALFCTPHRSHVSPDCQARVRETTGHIAMTCRWSEPPKPQQLSLLHCLCQELLWSQLSPWKPVCVHLPPWRQNDVSHPSLHVETGKHALGAWSDQVHIVFNKESRWGNNINPNFLRLKKWLLFKCKFLHNPAYLGAPSGEFWHKQHFLVHWDFDAIRNAFDCFLTLW